MEWEANFFAGEMIHPVDKVIWILDGKKPGEVINIEIYEKNYREFFGANRSMMEARLKALGYKLINAKNEWANYFGKQKETSEKTCKNMVIKHGQEMGIIQTRLTQIFTQMR